MHLSDENTGRSNKLAHLFKVLSRLVRRPRRTAAVVSSAAIIDDNVLDELVNVLTLSGIGELRRCVSAFENEFALAVGTRHAVGANSGTSALYFALRALGI